MKVVNKNSKVKEINTHTLNGFPWRRDEYFHHHNIKMLKMLSDAKVPLNNITQLFGESGFYISEEQIKLHIKLIEDGLFTIYTSWVLVPLGWWYTLTNPLVVKWFGYDEVSEKRRSKQRLIDIYNRLTKQH